MVFENELEINLENDTIEYKGDSAYQVACNNGFEGTEEEWLASLKRRKRRQRR